MSQVTQDTLNEITRRLVATYQPEQVVLLGSHAWGKPDEDVWVRTREEVLREAPLVTTLTHKIVHEGRVLHG